MKNYCASLLILLVFFAPAFGAAMSVEPPEEHLELSPTDRPDFTEASSTIPTGHVQLESGLEYRLIDPSGLGLHSLSALNLLGRIGVADVAEIRVGAPNVELHQVGDESETTWGEAALGAKFATALTPELRVGILPMAYIGVESSDLGGELLATASYEVTDSFELATNAGVAAAEDAAGDLVLEGLASLAAGYDLSDALGVYVEGYMIIGDQTDVFANTGLAYLLTPTLQIDAYVGLDVPDANVLFGGTGLSVIF